MSEIEFEGIFLPDDGIEFEAIDSRSYEERQEEEILSLRKSIGVLITEKWDARHRVTELEREVEVLWRKVESLMLERADHKAHHRCERDDD